MTSDNTLPRADQDQATYENTAKARRTIAVEGYIQRIAYNASGFAEYIGLAMPGTGDGDAGWQIKKLIYSGTNVIEINFADGEVNFNKVWDDRSTGGYVYA